MLRKCAISLEKMTLQNVHFLLHPTPLEPEALITNPHLCVVKKILKFFFFVKQKEKSGGKYY